MVFPIYQYEEDDNLRGIYESAIKLIKKEAILPTNNYNEFKNISDVYAPLKSVIVDVFDDKDMRDLLGERNISWLAREIASDSYSDLKRFLTDNFKIKTLDWKDLVLRMDADFLKQKSLVWMENMMSSIESYCIKRSSTQSHFINVSNIPLVRTIRNEQICARDKEGQLLVYLNNPDHAKHKIESTFIKNDTIKLFYQRVLLIPEYNIEQETIENVLPKYESRDNEFKTNNHIKENIEDLKCIMEAIKSNPLILDRIKDKYIVTDGKSWYKPSELHIPSEDKRLGYSLVKEILNLNFLSGKYFDDTVMTINLNESFFKTIGCNYGLKTVEYTKDEYLELVKKYQDYKFANELRSDIFHKKYISQKLNWSFCYEGFPAVFNDITKEKSIEIARFLNPNAMSFDIKGEIVGADDQHYSGKNVSSKIVYSTLGLYRMDFY